MTLRQRDASASASESVDDSTIAIAAVDDPAQLRAALLATRRFWLAHCNTPAAAFQIEKRYRLFARLAKQALDSNGSTTFHSLDLDAFTAVLHECRERLALLYLQRGNMDSARLLLQRLGCRARLSQEIIRYDISRATLSQDATPDCPCCFADDVASIDALDKLQKIFGPVDAPYWKEHRYCVDPPSPYFSYVVKLSETCDDTTVLGHLINSVRAAAALKVPRVATEANFVEIWAHNRPHQSPHQLHFDSEAEGLTEGGPKHPLATVVFVVDGRCGGPTLVTDQKLGDMKLATSGWLCFPQSNRAFIFDSNFLHGVIPGTAEAFVAAGAPADGRRTTLMMAFWKTMDQPEKKSCRECDGDDGFPGAAGRPIPSLDTASASELKWLRGLLSKCSSSTKQEAAATKMKLRAPPPLPYVWSRVSDDAPWPASAPIPRYEESFQF